ncbi:MAG: TIGR04086 family membrane protein [Lachnospiraceae bacterium]|nr:TIGR04086 family membrane protein [Lachnospiraceae bacterium]
MNMKKAGLRILLILAVELILTFLFVLALAGLAYKMSWEDTPVGIGVAVICVLTTFVGGILAGTAAKTRRFLWGALEGILYFAALSALAWLITHEFYGDWASMLLRAALCTVGGTAGGMMSRG